MTDRSGSLREQLAWQEKAECRNWDPVLWHADGSSIDDAKRICITCPVLNECRDYALTHNERHGVWGAMSEDDRRAWWKGRRRDAAPLGPCADCGRTRYSIRYPDRKLPEGGVWTGNHRRHTPRRKFCAECDAAHEKQQNAA